MGPATFLLLPRRGRHGPVAPARPVEHRSVSADARSGWPPSASPW